MRRLISLADEQGNTARVCLGSGTNSVLLIANESDSAGFRFTGAEDIERFAEYLIEMAGKIEPARYREQVELEQEPPPESEEGEKPPAPRVNGKKRTRLDGQAKKVRDRALVLDVLRGWSYQAVAKRYDVRESTAGAITKNELLALPIDDKPEDWSLGWARKNAKRLTEAYLSAQDGGAS